MADNLISSQVYLSRDQIRNQIISSITDYMELGNVDLTKSSFLSFLVNTISSLTSNLFFYNVSTYREFYLTLAQLPESIYNLSSFLGYTPKGASYSTAYVLMTVPLGFYDPGNPTVTFTMPTGFTFTANSVPFRTFYTTVVSITNNSSVTAKVILEDNREISIPVYIDTSTDPAQFYFSLPVRQLNSDTQQSQIAADLQPYVFTSVDLNITDQLSSLEVLVGDTQDVYTRYSSIYLIPVGAKGFVAEQRSFGERIYFGNGFIGVQPPAGAVVNINYSTTKGADGNVIAGSIANGGKIYVQLTSGEVRSVNYTCINPGQATGGVDEESLEDIRANAIKNIVSLSRLVTQGDFNNLNVVIPNSPYGPNSFPLLKRSDIRINEIQLYTTLQFLSETVPTKNIWYEITPDTTEIPKYTPLLFGTELYYNLFNMTIDKINGFAYYDYIVKNITLSPYLVNVLDPYYTAISISSLDVVNYDSTKVDLLLRYNGTDTSATSFFVVEETGNRYDFVNDTTNHYFKYTFDPYTLYPSGNTTIDIYLCKDLYSLPDIVSEYKTTLMISKSLKSSMMSNVVQDSTSDNLIIYDIPTVSKIYYDNLPDQREFEGVAIQPMVVTQGFENYRMLTDFINLKFSDTTGVLTGMQLNQTNKAPVIDFVDVPPLSPTVGDRYIVGPTSNHVDMKNHRNWYMQCTGFIIPSLAVFNFIDPTTNDIVYVRNQNKNYIYSGSEWVYPEYEIPLTVTVEIYKKPDYYGSDQDLIALVKTTLVNEFSSTFGINAVIRRSQIISTVHNTSGVLYCHLVDPKTDIFFDFNIDTFNREDLLRYSPEFIFFTDDTINVKIITPFEG